MITQSYEELVALIVENSEQSKEQVEEKIQAKLKQLSGLISKEGAAHIIANELGVKLSKPPAGVVKVQDLRSDNRDVGIVAKVMQVYPVNEFQRKDGTPGKVANVMVGDETGTTKLTLWGEMAEYAKQAKENDVVKVSGGYVRENNGRLEVHLNERSNVTINPEGLDVAVKSRPMAERKFLNQVDGSEESVEALGTIVQVFDPRFFEVCPECKRRAKPKENVFVCDTHGSVTPQYGAVVNLVLDDGSDNVRTVFFRQQLEQLLGKNVEVYRADPESFSQVKHDLLGQIIKVVARPKKNEMFNRVELVVNRVDPNPDPKDELERLEAK